MRSVKDSYLSFLVWMMILSKYYIKSSFLEWKFLLKLLKWKIRITLYNPETEYFSSVDKLIFISPFFAKLSCIFSWPREDAAKLCEEWGYEDQLIDRAEVFGLWVVESDSNLPLEQLEKELPFKEAGLNVVFTKDHHPYKERKVRILNGSHTSFVLASFLAGNDNVENSMKDPVIRKYMEETLYNEVIPTLSLSKEDCEEFAKAVIDRFLNPFVDHRLLSISLNSVSKWEARCLPSFLGYVNKFNKLPKYLTFSIAALMSFYTSQTEAEFNGGIVLKGNRNGEEYNITDDKAVLDFFRDNSGKSAKEFTHAYLSNTKFFGGEDLSKVLNLEEVITEYITDIRERGMRAVVNDLAD